MSDVQINTRPGGPMQIIINGVDYSNEIYRDHFKIVEVGEGEAAEVGLQVTFAVSKLSIDNESDVQLTDRVRSVAARVRSIAEDVA